MSYEYSSATGRFEISNPYRIENLAFMVAGAAAMAAGLYLLISFRQAIAHGELGGIKGIVVGLALLTVGIGITGRALMQLRYFFGRGRPHDLTNLDAQRPQTAQQRADWLKENLRQNALAYREPHGAIHGLAHQIFNTLIFAPRLIRRAAETQFFNLLLSAAILFGLLAGMLFYSDQATQSWIALLFLAILVPTLIRPFGRGETTFREGHAGIAFIVFIIAIPILGPPLLERIGAAVRLPYIEGFELPRTLLICLLILLGAQALFFAALMKQLRARPTINMACEQRALSMNGNPSKLFEELERMLQTRWVETIPNRRYSLIKLPEVLSGKSGSFSGEALEETQPTPAVESGPSSFVDQLRSPATKAIAAMTALGTLTFVLAVGTAIRFAIQPLSAQQTWSTGFLALTFIFTSWYCVRSAHLLWGRVDFNSILLWVEINGSFEEARVNIGNQLTTAMSSSKAIINIESMTLRVWVAEIDTVILEKDGLRDLVGMRGRPELAKFYADHLERFATQIPSVVAPTSKTDSDRMNVLANIQHRLGQPPGTAALLGSVSNAALPAATVPAPPPPRLRCINPQCGQELDSTALFCSTCGTPQTRAS